jgi:hypothetical protein
LKEFEGDVVYEHFGAVGFVNAAKKGNVGRKWLSHWE